MPRKKQTKVVATKTPAVNWGLHTYTPAACNLDPFENPRQIGFTGLASDRRHIVTFSLEALDRLISYGVRRVGVFVVAAGGWTYEDSIAVDVALKLAKKLKS